MADNNDNNNTQKNKDNINKCNYSFDLSRVPALYDFVNGDAEFDCKCEDNCIKCKKMSVTNIDSENNDKKSLYYLVNYDKKTMKKLVESGVEYDYAQHVRSVVLNENRKIVCFSPPMCEPKHVELDISKVRFVEEFVEGTMVNLFYNSSNDVQKWEFSTKNVVSPLDKKDNKEGTGGKCFRKMFLEACAASKLNLSFDDLPKEYSYSFVMQHPDNVIVAPVERAALYIVAVYYIGGTTVYEMDRSVVNWGRFSKVMHPARFTMKGEEDFNKILNLWASSNSLYYYPGVMFRTHSGERFKFRNPNYEFVKNTKGAEDKSRFVYLHLKKLGMLKTHFDRFPEDELEFFRHQTNLYNYTHNLHKNYMDCYVFKKMVLKDFPVEYKQNIFNLHKNYNLFLRPSGKRVNMSYVIEFMNEQSVKSQMFVIKKFEDSCNEIKHSDSHVSAELKQVGQCSVNTPEQEKEEVMCPGAP
jgi:hypothetical protein